MAFKLDEGCVKRIEKRISLMGGSTLWELAADVANQLGDDDKELQEAILHRQIVSDVQQGKDGRGYSREILPDKVAMQEAERNEVAVRQRVQLQRREKIQTLEKPIYDYLVREYGAIRRDANHLVVGIGSLRVDSRHHIFKTSGADLNTIAAMEST